MSRLEDTLSFLASHNGRLRWLKRPLSHFKISESTDHAYFKWVAGEKMTELSSLTKIFFTKLSICRLESALWKDRQVSSIQFEQIY